MQLTPRLQTTLDLATHLHRHQKRYDTLETPYIVHLVSVMVLVSEVTDDEATLCAALMHDSLEDVPGYTYEQLAEDCGEDVAEIVRGVTEIRLDTDGKDRDEKWMTRKKRYIETLQNDQIQSAYVSCGDKIHNLESLIRAFKKEGPTALSHFVNMKVTLWFHGEVYKVAAEKLGEDNVLVKRYKGDLEEAHQLFEGL